MPTLTFRLPDVALKVNRRVGAHWSTTDELKKVEQLFARDAIRDQFPFRLPSAKFAPYHVTCTVYLGKGQRADTSDVGTWCKHLIDQMVRSGVFFDDSPKWIRPFTSDVQRDAKNPRVEISW